MNINKNKEKAQGVKENEEISKLKIIISEKEQIIQKLNSELELLKKNKNFENNFNKYYSPQKKIFKNIDINLDSNNEKTICSNLNVSQEFKNKSNVKLKLSPKQLEIFIMVKLKLNQLLKEILKY